MNAKPALPLPARIRPGVAGDIAALLAIEQASFDSDRLSRRSFRHLLTEGNSVTLIDEGDGVPRAYITLLFRADVSLARIYSIATAPAWLGQGLAAGLLEAAEALALAHNCVAMRLEIRRDNIASQQLFCATVTRSSASTRLTTKMAWMPCAWKNR